MPSTSRALPSNLAAELGTRLSDLALAISGLRYSAGLPGAPSICNCPGSDRERMFRCELRQAGNIRGEFRESRTAEPALNGVAARKGNPGGRQVEEASHATRFQPSRS